MLTLAYFLKKKDKNFDQIWSSFVADVQDALPEESPVNIVEDHIEEEADVLEENLVDPGCQIPTMTESEKSKQSSETFTDVEPEVKDRIFSNEERPLCHGSKVKDEKSYFILLFINVETQFD